MIGQFSKPFQTGMRSCSGFGMSFDSACQACARDVLALRDEVLVILGVKEDETERAVCGVGVVISLAVEMINDASSIDDFFRCLPALDSLRK